MKCASNDVRLCYTAEALDHMYPTMYAEFNDYMFAFRPNMIIVVLVNSNRYDRLSLD